MNTGRQQQDYREKHKKYFETQQYQKSLEQIQKLDAGVSELLAVSDINIKEITPLIDQIEEEIETISHLSIVNDDIAITINAYQEKIARYKNVIENVNTKNRNALLFQLMAVNHDVNETLSEQQFFGNFNNVNYMVAEMERLADKLLNLEQELQAFEEINLQQLIACKALIQEIPNSSSLGSYNCYQSLAKQAKQQFMLFADEMKRIFPDYAEKYEN